MDRAGSRAHMYKARAVVPVVDNTAVDGNAAVAVDPAHDAILETRPLHFDPSTLMVNADVDPADLQVELVEESGPVVQYQSNPIEGF